MKGAIFTMLQEMVEEQFGLECWETMLANSNLPSQGIYTSAETYDDSEAFELLGALSEYSKIPTPELLEAFGRYMFPHLAHSLPAAMMDYPDLWSFLAAVHDVVHVEVKKLDKSAITPDIIVTSQTNNQATLTYRSPRKMCFLALGLIHKAAEHFDTKVAINHQQCMHEGHDHCSLLITKAQR